MNNANDKSYLEYGKHGATSIVGPDAIAMFRAFTLASGIRLYLKTGLIPTRGCTPKVMRELATGITKKQYKRSELAKAADDVHEWAITMKAALPAIDRAAPDSPSSGDTAAAPQKGGT